MTSATTPKSASTTQGLEASLFADAIEALHEGIQIISPEWRYVFVNEAVTRQGRKSREELLGRTMQECYPGIDKTPLFAVLERCMRARSGEIFETEFVFEDGRRGWFELRIRPCAAGLVIASVDVTERRTIELRLRDAYQQALRDLVTPVIRVHDRVLLVPLVGALDAKRTELMVEAVLTRVEASSAKAVIFDISGVPSLDTAVADSLLKTTAMLRLLGATTILTGLAPEASRTIVQLGVDLSSVETTTRLSDGLALALAKVGMAVVKQTP